MRKTYIPKMGPKKPAVRPIKRKVDYDNGRDLMDRDLKNWYLQHKDYYHDFKSSLENAFLNDDKESIHEIFGGLSPLITNKMSILKAGKRMFSKDPVKLGEFEKSNTEAVDWVSNDLDATIASTFHPFQANKLDALKDSFEKGELFNDRSRAFLYWFRFDNGQMFLLLQMSLKMGSERLTDQEQKWGDMVTESIVDKGVTTRSFIKKYWKEAFLIKGMRSLKKKIAEALTFSKGRGGRFTGIYLLEDLLIGPDKDTILRNIGTIINNRKKDTDLACLLVLLVRTGNVEDSIKYKPFHEALKSQFPDAGIGTERRPQQLFNNIVLFGGKTLTTNTLKRCENLIEEQKRALLIQ